MATKDGGTAFPAQFGFGGATPGMSLRDYFAGQALLGIIAGGVMLHTRDETIQLPEDRQVVERAYRYADAMLVEQEKTK